MHPTEPIYLRRDCDALMIPSGLQILLLKGSPIRIQQSLGGTYTVNTGSHLVRIDERDADALGLELDREATKAAAPAACDDQPVDHQEVRRQLMTCYDPEIPVNILDLGLIYSCAIGRRPEGGHHIQVRMTLTAPGCGMGAVLAADVKRKLLQVRGIRSVEVQLVFDPPWDANRMSEAAKLQLGML